MPCTQRRSVIAHHLILTGYGHWLPNDLRGSGSHVFYDPKLAPLGPIHRGRRPPEEQPSRAELRDFYKRAAPLLNFETMWFDDAKRQVVAEAFREVVRRERYTVYACAILSNHAHLVIRRHRDDALTMLTKLADASRLRLRSPRKTTMNPDHPIWSQRPYKVFLYAPEDVRGRIDYVNQNPLKEGLPPQEWDFVAVYDNWPRHKQAVR
jgi:REP element-mobilizing transposase RayT